MSGADFLLDSNVLIGLVNGIDSEEEYAPTTDLLNGL